MVEERNSRMRAAPESTITAETSATPVSRPQWHRIYYLLAAFNVITVVASFYILSQVLNTHQRSVQVNQEWTDRLNSYGGLNQLTATVNAPGNDVFDSPNVEIESEKLRAASSLFEVDPIVKKLPGPPKGSSHTKAKEMREERRV